MAEDVVFKVSVQGKSLAELKREFSDINKELSNAKLGTEEYQRTLEKLGNVKDEIGDLRDTINALNPEGKVAAFQNVAGKLAGGFQAATGAAALFGSKSEELEKQLLKVQAATAFAQGIQSIVGLSDAFNVLKATLLSFNPILLIAVGAVVAIGAAYKVWSDNMSDAAQNDAILNAELERQVRLQENINKELDRNLALDKELAKSESERIKLELDAEIKRYAALRTREILLQGIIDKTDEQREESKKLDQQEKDSFNTITLLKIKGNKAVREEEKKLNEESKAARKKAAEDYDAEFKKRMQSYADEAEAARRLRQELSAQRLKEFEDRTNLEKSWQDSAKQNQITALDEQALDFDTFLGKKMDANKIATDHEIELAKKAQAEKIKLAEDSFGAMANLSDLYFSIEIGNAKKGSTEELKLKKKQFEITKAFNLASAIMNGYKAVTTSLASSPVAIGLIPNPAGIASLAFAISTSLLNIAKIASTKFESTTPTIPSSNPTVPTINTPTTSATQPGTRLNPDGTKQTGGYMQAYVLEKDITDKQKQTGRIQKQGKF